MGNRVGSGKDSERSAAPVIDPEWMYEVARRCQIIMCSLHSREDLIKPVVSDPVNELPTPSNRLERLVLRGLLFEIALVSSGASPASASWDSRFLQDIVAKNWAGPQRASSALAAAAAIERDYSSGLRMTDLARSIGCHDTTLRRGFRQVFSLSMKQFQVLVRVESALLLFAAGNRKLLSVARLVGYKNEKKLASAILRLTGRHASELRTLSQAELLSLVAHLRSARLRNIGPPSGTGTKAVN